VRLEPELVEQVRVHLAETGGAVTAARVATALRAQGRLVADEELLELLRRLESEMVGVGPLAALLRDPRTTDVLVNAPDEVWVDQGGGLRRTTVRFPDERSVRRLAQRLAVQAGRRLDDAQPWVDARLPDGSRLHAVLPPVATGGTCVSLRVLRPQAWPLDRLVDCGSLTPPAAGLLRDVVRARLTFLVTGGTGSGKTTLLASLLAEADPGDRLLLVEEAGELRPSHPHVVRLEARPANVEGAGEVTVRDLVRQALRMRPDRLVVGEVRGAEVVDLLAALNTGHEGSAATLHANGPAEVPARLEALAALGGLGREALHSQLAATVSLLVHVHRDPAGARSLREISVLEPGPDGMRAAPAWRADGGPCPGARRLAELLARGGVREGPASPQPAALPALALLGLGPLDLLGAVPSLPAAVVLAATGIWLALGTGSSLARLRPAAAGRPEPEHVAQAAPRRTRQPAVPVAAVALAFLAAFGLLGWAAAASAALVSFAGLRLAARARDERSSRRRRRHLLHVLAVLAAELRAGRAPPAALAVCAGEDGLPLDDPVRVLLRRSADTAALGGDVAAALRPDSVLARRDPPCAGDLRWLAAAWQVSERCGAGLADVVGELEAGTRARSHTDELLASQLAAPMATASLLAALPLLGIVLGAALGADPVGVLLHTPVGSLCLVLGCALDVAGLLWAQRLVAGVRARA